MSRPSLLATPLPAATAAEADALLALLRSDAGRGEKRARAPAWILAVVEESLRYHLREPLAALGVGALTRSGLSVALDLAVRGLRGPARAVVFGLSDAQLRVLSGEIGRRPYADPHRTGPA